MKISLIIPSYNEESVVLGCLKSLDDQSLNGFEVLVVDDGSSDKTIEKVKSYKAKNYKLILLSSKHLGPGGARNIGAKKASGQILVFVDSDMTFDKDFVKKITDPIVKGETKGTFSKEEIVSNWDIVWARCYSQNENWEEKRRHPKNYPDKQKVFRAILKSEFEKVGGFTPGGYNDDWSLSEKLGYEADNAEGAVFYHKNPESLEEIFNHAQWVGKRKYKLGKLGFIAGLARVSFPVSVIVGVYKSIVFNNPHFLVFKIVFDFGVFVGIIKYMLSGKGYK